MQRRKDPLGLKRSQSSAYSPSTKKKIRRRNQTSTAIDFMTANPFESVSYRTSMSKVMNGFQTTLSKVPSTHNPTLKHKRMITATTASRIDTLETTEGSTAAAGPFVEEGKFDPREKYIESCLSLVE